MQLRQLLRSGWGLGVVIEDAAVEIQVGDLGEAAGQRHADIAQDDRPGNLLVEGRTLDPLDRVLNQRVILKSSLTMTYSKIEDRVLILNDVRNYKNYEPKVNVFLFLVRHSETFIDQETVNQWKN